MPYTVPYNDEMLELLRAIDQCPNDENSLVFGDEDLEDKTNDELRDLFSYIAETKKNISAICIKSQKLNRRSTHLARIFQKLPLHLRSLDLSDNHLWEMNPADLTNAVNAIPSRLTSINLSKNKLSRGKNGQLSLLIGALPQTIESLDLSDNGFGELRLAESLIAKIPRIPMNIRSLNLSANQLAELHTEVLINIFRNLPQTITSLDLRQNGFSNKSNAELDRIYGAIGTHVDVKKDYNLNEVLDKYLDKRRSYRLFHQAPVDYFCFNFFSLFKQTFSFTDKEEAVNALKRALTGEEVNLIPYIPTLENGTLGDALKRFITSGKADSLIDERKTTVSDFIHAYQLRLNASIRARESTQTAAGAAF